MADRETIKKQFVRNARVVELRPARGKYSSSTSVRLREGLTCDIEDGSWKLVADMGPDAGGDARGPTPGTYGRAALGSCLAIATAQWAARMDVVLDDLQVEVISDADAAGAYGVSDTPPGYSQVRCKVTVKSAATDEEIRKVVDVATERCLVWDVFARAMDVRRELNIVREED
jgi:uncharacterized OsmC-like protein